MKTSHSIVSFILATCLSALFLSSHSAAEPVAVRNDVTVAGKEVLMLRHAFLKQGGYPQWYKASREGVWPWYEKIGTRIVGDWQVFYPENDSQYPQSDEAWRLARYASFEHWQATRGVASKDNGDTGGHVKLGGNGGDYQAMVKAIKTRTEVQTGSKGGIFLQGYMAQTRPLYMPGLNESYSSSNKAPNSGDAIPLRSGVSKPGKEILTMEYFRIRKGSFEQFHTLTNRNIWPMQEKIGIRPVGHWQVIHTPASGTKENAKFDEVYQLTRYASIDHWQASRDVVTLGGNGRDYIAMQDAQERLKLITMESTVQFLRGPMYGSIPLYLPSLNEHYRKH